MNTHPAWWLLATAALLAVVGLVWLLAGRIPWLGHLPGDIRYEGERVRIYVPIVTCIILSILLTILLNLVARFWR